MMDRRQWLKSGLLAAAGLPLHARLAPPPLASSASSRADGPVRLNANENPYGLPDSARRALVDALTEAHRYPSSDELRRMIAEREGLTPDHVVIGAGSSEVLRMAGAVYGLYGSEFVASYPTYEYIAHLARVFGAHLHQAPVDDDLTIDLETLERRTTRAARLVYVCNPDNPTGRVVPAGELRAFCEAVAPRTPVLVDEAYHEFAVDPAYASMAPLVQEGHNVIVTRTFSKIYGMAGLRVGYGLARPDLIARLREHSSLATACGPSLAAAAEAYRDTDYVAFVRARMQASRAILGAALDERGLRRLPSNTNFVFFELGRDVGAFGRQMRERGFRVGRPFPPYTTWCRLTLGTPETMHAFVDAFRAELTD